MKLGRTIFFLNRRETHFFLKEENAKEKKRQTKAHLQRKIKTSGKQKKKKKKTNKNEKNVQVIAKIDGKKKRVMYIHRDNVPTTFQLFKKKTRVERGREMTAPITKDAPNDINSTPRSTTLATALQWGHSCAGSASGRRCGSKPSL